MRIDREIQQVTIYEQDKVSTGRDGNVAEITEPHSTISRGVMSRRAHQAESGLAPQRGTRCLDCRAG